MLKKLSCSLKLRVEGHIKQEVWYLVVGNYLSFGTVLTEVRTASEIFEPHLCSYAMKEKMVLILETEYHLFRLLGAESFSSFE